MQRYNPKYTVGRVGKGRTPYAKRRKPPTKSMVVAGFTRTAGPYARAYRANPSRRQTLGGIIEKKFYDTAWGTTNVTSAGIIATHGFLAIAQGTTENTRVGGKITVVNVNFRGELTGVNDSSQVPEVARFIFLWDKQANGAQPAVTDILQTASVNSFLNMDNVERFQVIKDKMVTMDTNTYDAASTDAVYVDTKLIKLNYKCSVPIHYSSTTGAITELKSNNLILLLISMNGVCFYRGRMRVKFTDA